MEVNTNGTDLQQEDMGIDVAALVRYLYQSRFIIVAIAMLPIAGYLLFAAMQQKDHNDNLIASIVKINQRLENFNPNAIISEDIVAEALRQNAIEVTPAELVPLLNVVVGFERLNDPIDAALAKLAGEVSVGRGEDPDDIQARYDNLIASQNNFLTIYFNMEKSPIDWATAKILVSDIIGIFNQRFEEGMIQNAPILSELDLADLDQLPTITPYTLGQFRSFVTALKDRTSALKEEGFNKQGFNPEVLSSRLTYIDLQLSGIIATSEELQRYFNKDIDREINIATEHIASLEKALNAITEKKSGLGAGTGRGGSREQSSMAAEYNSELFERFLNVGASLSLIEFQESLLNQKLELEFRRTELEQLKKSYSDPSIQAEEVDALYTDLTAETRAVAESVNAFVKDYNRNYQKQVLSLVDQQTVESASILEPKPILLVLVGAFGLAIAIGVLRFAFRD